MVSGDSGQLDRLVMNLLSNAVKFTPAGGSVSVGTGCDGGLAVLRVSDTGIGIPEHDRKELFTRFFRASNAVEESIPGTGLGLAIARTIVANHHGDLDVTSLEGKGTTVTVRIPLLADRAGLAAAARRAGLRRGQARMRPRGSIIGQLLVAFSVCAVLIGIAAVAGYITVADQNAATRRVTDQHTALQRANSELETAFGTATFGVLFYIETGQRSFLAGSPRTVRTSPVSWPRSAARRRPRSAA